MARSRKVGADTAVSGARDLFWKYGYGALGTRQIEEEAGLTRFTLQTSHGGKMGLFVSALDSYLDRTEKFLPSLLADGLGGIVAFFEWRSQPRESWGIGSFGCLMLNSLVEFRGEDAEVNERGERYFAILRHSFRDGLAAARDAGDLRPDIDIDDKAEILMGLALAMNVIIRAGGDNAAALPVAASAIAMVRGWAKQQATEWINRDI